MRLTRATLAHWRGQAVAHVVFGLRNAVEAVGHNKLRAGLTSLGILFGVASVIAMLAIGKGAEQEILDQMRLLGSNTIVVQPLVEQNEGEVKDNSDKQPRRFTPGLSFADAQAIAAIVPHVHAVSGEIVLNTTTTREGRRRSGKLVGVEPSYFEMNNLELARGTWFTPTQIEYGLPVAIIGRGVRTRFFTTEDPIGKTIKVGDTWLTVVGVLADRRLSGEIGRLGIRDANMDVYVPLRTMLGRFRDRSRITQAEIERLAQAQRMPQQQEETFEEDEEARAERLNRNQLDRILVQMEDSRHVNQAADVIRRMLTRRHNNVVDFEIVIPEMLLKQEQRAKTIFNVVLGAIASISLIVGGIGIMNIMLASVLERIREIGVRRALGATQRDILFQFLTEAVLISVAGGLAGVLVGGGISLGIERFAGISTIVSYVSVFVAFGVSFSVGLLFGIVPAYRAARQDPVVCLRYE